ncbi:ABC transporter permease [Ignatzschineria sp. LJL83]
MKHSLFFQLNLRLLRVVGLVLFITFATFALIKASPVDPISHFLGPAISKVSAEQRAQIAAVWGLDQPYFQQFLSWIKDLLHGDFGYSITYNKPVIEVFKDRLAPTLLLTGSAWILSGLLGFVLALVAAAFEGRWIDRMIRFYCTILTATPAFWLGMLMLIIFSVELHWMPICCAGPIGVVPEDVTLWQTLYHLILPLLTLTLFGVAQMVLHSRTKLLEVLKSDYVMYAYAQGASKWDVLLHHGVRNASLPALTVLFASIGELFGGAMLAEQVFAWPGLGRATVEAGLRGDVALLLAITLITTIVVTIGNMIVDILYQLLDPRLRERA